MGYKLISFLIESGARLNEREICGHTPSLIAANFKNWHIVRKMFTTSTDLKAVAINGYSALHYAIMGNSMSTVKLLEKHGPTIVSQIVDSTGKEWGSTLTLANEYGSLDLVQNFWHDGPRRL